MHVNIAICDDERIQIEYITDILVSYQIKNNLNLKISNFYSAESLLFTYEDNNDFDILLLDIEMDKMNGVELARKIRENNNAIQIIFITGFPDYILDGYDVSALHYLIKPILKEKLFPVLDKAIGNLNKRRASIVLRTMGNNSLVYIEDIIYIEAFAHYIAINTLNDTYSIKMGIGQISKKLDNNFVFCHRSYIINIKNIKKITKVEVILDNDIIIPLSRRMYDTVNKLFINYYKD